MNALGMWLTIIIIIIIISFIVLIVLAFATIVKSKDPFLTDWLPTPDDLSKRYPVLSNRLVDFYEMQPNGYNRYKKTINNIEGKAGTFYIQLYSINVEQVSLITLFRIHTSEGYEGQTFDGLVVTINYDSIEQLDESIRFSIKKLVTDGVLSFDNEKLELILLKPLN